MLIDLLSLAQGAGYKECLQRGSWYDRQQCLQSCNSHHISDAGSALFSNQLSRVKRIKFLPLGAFDGHCLPTVCNSKLRHPTAVSAKQQMSGMQMNRKPARDCELEGECCDRDWCQEETAPAQGPLRREESLASHPSTSSPC